MVDLDKISIKTSDPEVSDFITRLKSDTIK